MENSENVSKNGHLVVPVSGKTLQHKTIGLVQDRRESLGAVYRLVKPGSPTFFPVPQSPQPPRSLSRAGTPRLDDIAEDIQAGSPSI